MTNAHNMTPDIHTIGVIGAGQMGGGIAHVCALAGYNVRLSDISQERLDEALKVLAKNLERQVAREKISQADMDAALGRVSTSTGLEAFGDCDVVIESVTENEEVKKEILREL